LVHFLFHSDFYNNIRKYNMIKNTLKSFAVLSTILYSFNSFSVAIPACDTNVKVFRYQPQHKSTH
jgi:hypothetical protein